MNTSSMTNLDCYAAARQKNTIITCQRKINRLLNFISEKERFAARYKSRFMCEQYDKEIEALYEKVAELEGLVMATELELEQFQTKRQELETLRMVRLLQFAAPTLEPAPAPTPPPTPSATPRTEQLAMFGPGPAPIDTRPIGTQSAADREWAVENDIALGFELANEIPAEEKAESAGAVMAPASTQAASPAVAPQAEQPAAAPTTGTTAATPEPQPFRFAYVNPSNPPSAQPAVPPSPAVSPIAPGVALVETAPTKVRRAQIVSESRETLPDTRPLNAEPLEPGSSK